MRWHTEAQWGTGRTCSSAELTSSVVPAAATSTRIPIIAVTQRFAPSPLGLAEVQAPRVTADTSTWRRRTVS